MMQPRPFSRSFTQQEPLGEAEIAAAVDVLRSGRLHRYNVLGDEESVVSRLETEFAAYQGVAYCLACASGGYALQIALRAAGLERGEPVLTNAFTLAPVPGAIVAAGGEPVLVETTGNLTIDFEDLAAKQESSGARILMLSHMRGHLADMDELERLSKSLGLRVVEDCAHTMGAEWNGRKSGNFGLAGCFSTQTYKHLNSGEGGLVTSADESFMAKAVLLSGSYMLYERHSAAPPAAVYEDLLATTPNCSGRMDNLRAAVLRPQLGRLDENVSRWNRRYRAIEERLREDGNFVVPVRPPEERYVGSSIQFRLRISGKGDAERFIAATASLGVEVKWFGAERPAGYTSTHRHWGYLAPQSLPKTDTVLASLFDIRIPLTFSPQDCEHVAEILAYAAHRLGEKRSA